MKTLVFLIGPPAVGKMTVGHALSALTGLPLFHNHLSIEAVLPIFPFGSPAFGRLVGQFRERVFEEVAESDHPGLIFTFVWAFDEPRDLAYIEGLKAIFETRGHRAVFVELYANVETRMRRNMTEPRITAKPSKRDLEQSRARLLDADTRHRLNSTGDFPFADHLRIDNSRLEPAAVAEQIVAHFGIPTRHSTSA